jgi:hypothetical protein
VPSQLGANTRWVVVRHSVHIERPVEAVRIVFEAGPRNWLNVASLGSKVKHVDSQKIVAVEVGEPLAIGDWIEVPVKWQATFIKKLLPVMAGTIEVSPVDPRFTRLTVCGMYQSPEGRRGEQLDETLMHRVAQATVMELAESIAKQIEALTADPTGGPV